MVNLKEGGASLDFLGFHVPLLRRPERARVAVSQCESVGESEIHHFGTTVNAGLISGFNVPSGIAVDGSDLFVTNHGGAR